MGYSSRSYDYPSEKPPGHRHGSHREPRAHQEDLDLEAAIQISLQSLRIEQLRRDGRHHTAHYEDITGSGNHHVHARGHGAHVTINGRAVQGMSDHSTKDGHHHGMPGAHHGERSTHKHGNERDPHGQTTRSGHGDERSTHKHGDKRDPHGQPTRRGEKSGHHGMKTSERHIDNDEGYEPTDYYVPHDYRKLRERLYQQAFQPVSKNTGTPYPCSQADIDFHKEPKFKSSKPGPFVKGREATTEVLWQNDKSRPTSQAEQSAIDRLLSIVITAENGSTLGPDLAIKAFADLDLVFFGGKLNGSVKVRWVENRAFGPRASGWTWGDCGPNHSYKGRCNIRLNAEMIFRRGWDRHASDHTPATQLFGTLLHEMCHAYEQVRSPSDIEPYKIAKGHGPYFNTRVGVIHKRAMRIFGLWAVDRYESYRQLHIYVPFCEESGKNDNAGKGRGEGKDGGPAKGGNVKPKGAAVGPRRPHKGTDCVIM